MSENGNKERNDDSFFKTLSTLKSRKEEGTFGEIIEDWKWIFRYSKHYKGAIFLYTCLGVFSSSMSLVSSVAGKHVIDIITGYQVDKLPMMIFILLGSAGFSIFINNVLSRITLKLRININNEIQADIFDKIVDSEWLSLSKYSSGDILNRFSNDTGTVATNAISWLPSIIIAVYNFVITFIAIWSLSKVMALISFGTAPVLLLMSRYLIRRQREYGKKVREMSSF